MIDRLNAALEGRYRIESELGQGGMATVFLAEDMKHRRKVALKVLKPELAAVVGAERFLAEIETTAGLQHPHILPLFDSGEADGFLYYVMPYVEGDSLRERLNQEKQLPVAETIRIATDVAEALDCAHRHDVIHRDVKPANILLQDGRPVVADFGIALAVSQAGGGRLTETGLSLGTPYYMSPEQATGDREVDARSDIYALGCVVYEMLTGEPPFSGKTAQAVLGRILMGNVDPPTVHRKAIPPHVEGAILRALEKLPADRFATAKELVEALENPGFRHATGGAPGEGEAAARGRGSWQKIAGVAVAVGTLAAAAGWWAGRGTPETPAVERHHVVLGNGPEKVSKAVAFRAALHPGGLGIIFPGTATEGNPTTPTLWWKARSALEPTRLPAMDGAVSPTFSPDGEWILFVRNGELRKQPLSGGNSVTLMTGVSGGTAHALAWLDDGTVVFETGGFVIQRMAADGQEAADTVSVEARTGQPIHMSGLPGGRGVLVSACVGSCPAGTMLSLLDLEGDTVAKLADDVVRAWPAPDHHVVYLTRSGSVYAARLAPDAYRLGPPIPLFDGVRVSNDANGEMHVAPDGTALYVKGTDRAGSYRVAILDRTGRSTLVDLTWLPQNFVTMALSPDARHLAVSIAGPEGEQIWVKELPRGPLIPLTPNEPSASRPVWFSDGSRVAYTSVEVRRQIRSVRADGTSRAPDTLFETPPPPYELELTAGGDTLLMRVSSTAGNAADIVLVDLAGGGEPVPLLTTPFNENTIDLSPNGRWLAYVSNVSGRNEVYVRPFPNVSDGQIPISRDGGIEPLWSRGGDELFYRDASGWMISARISADSSGLRVEERERLFDASDYGVVGGWRGYDVFPGAERFLMLEPGPGGVGAVGDLVLVENLFQEMREKIER